MASDEARHRAVLKSTADLPVLAPLVRQVCGERHPDMPCVEVRSTEATFEPWIREWRVGAMLFSLFGAIGLLAAAVGLYDIVACVTVTQHGSLPSVWRPALRQGASCRQFRASWRGRNRGGGGGSHSHWPAARRSPRSSTASRRRTRGYMPASSARCWPRGPAERPCSGGQSPWAVLARAAGA